MKPSAVILALDASSTTIGWCLYADRVRAHGTVTLVGNDIAERCRQAHAALTRLLAKHPDVDVLAIESPVARHAKALIPQARVSGALLAVAALKKIPVVEVSPALAKRALAGKGNATKSQMMEMAAEYGVFGEHASDALGIVLACVPRVRVTV